MRLAVGLLVFVASVASVASSGCKQSSTAQRETPPAPAPSASPAPSGLPPTKPAALQIGFAPAGDATLATRKLERVIYLKQPVAPAAMAPILETIRKRVAPLPVFTPAFADGRDGAAPRLNVIATAIEPDQTIDENMLQHFSKGLTPAQKATAHLAKGAVVIVARLDNDPDFARLRAIDVLVGEVATKLGGFIWDEDARLMFTPTTWREQHVASWQGAVPNVIAMVATHIYQEDYGTRMITLGLGAFGLPDLVIEDGGEPDSDRLGMLLMLAAQSLVEKQSVLPEGKLRVEVRAIKHGKARQVFEKLGDTKREAAALTLRLGTLKAGDADNRLWELAFAPQEEMTRYEVQTALTEAVFGKLTNDEPVNSPADDAELAAIQKRVQKRVPAMRAAVQKGLVDGEALAIKVPFEYGDDGREWMWVTVSSWSGTKVKGLLDNQPSYIKTLRLGSPVEVEQDLIADFAWKKADGSVEGMESAAVLKRRATK